MAHTRAFARLARAWIVLTAVGAAGLSIVFHWEPAATWWVELLRYVPFPVFLAPALVAVLASVWQSARWRMLAALSLVLVLTAIMGLSVSVGDKGSSVLRVMTFNAKIYLAKRTPEGFSRIAWQIAEHDPDVLVVQDATFDDEVNIPPPIRAALGTRQIYLSGQYLVASRFPLRDCRSGWFSRDQLDNAQPARPDYVRCTLIAHGLSIDLATVHLVSPRRGLNAAREERDLGLTDWRANLGIRLDQVNGLVRSFAGTGRAWIIAGDLNAPEHSPVVQRLLRLGLRDAFSAGGTGYGYTLGHALRPGFSFLRVDHILISAGIGVRQCYVGGSDASEHRPVIADLLLRL